MKKYVRNLMTAVLFLYPVCSLFYMMTVRWIDEGDVLTIIMYGLLVLSTKFGVDILTKEDHSEIYIRYLDEMVQNTGKIEMKMKETDS